MSATKHKQAGFQPNKNDVLSNTSEEEIIHISMRNGQLSERQIEEFQAKNEYPKKERWVIEFGYRDNSQFVVYFTEEAAKKFVEEVNKSFNNISNREF